MEKGSTILLLRSHNKVGATRWFIGLQQSRRGVIAAVKPVSAFVAVDPAGMSNTSAPAAQSSSVAVKPYPRLLGVEHGVA